MLLGGKRTLTFELLFVMCYEISFILFFVVLGIEPRVFMNARQGLYH